MKKTLTIMGLIALAGGALLLTGCKCMGSCPLRGDQPAKLCGCGAVKGSEVCVAACKKPVKLCGCGAVKGSPACVTACGA